MDIKDILENKMKDLESIISEIDSDKVVLKEIMTLKQLCRYLKLSQQEVNLLIENSLLPHYKNSKSQKIYFYKQDIDIWKKKYKSN